MVGYIKDGYKTYQNGDYKKDAELYKKSCDGRTTLGCYNLGVMYKNGERVKQDYAKAKQVFSKACDLKLELGCENYKKLNS